MKKKAILLFALLLTASLIFALPLSANAYLKHGSYRSTITRCKVCGQNSVLVQYGCSIADYPGWTRQCTKNPNCIAERDNQGTCWVHGSCHSDTVTYNRHAEYHTICANLGCQY